MVIMSITQNESYKHKYAKELLFNWFKNGAFDDYKNVCGDWHGDDVYMDYPIIKVEDQDSFRNIMGFNYNFGDGRCEHYESLTNYEIAPTYKQCVDYGEIPIAVADIALIHKGTVSAIFEICHINKVSDNKIDKIMQKFDGCICDIYKIKADDILKQTKKPTHILKYCEQLY